MGEIPCDSSTAKIPEFTNLISSPVHDISTGKMWSTITFAFGMTTCPSINSWIMMIEDDDIHSHFTSKVNSFDCCDPVITEH